MIKIVWSWKNHKHNVTEYIVHKQIDICKYGQLTFDSGAKAMQKTCFLSSDSTGKIVHSN